jgi:beta-mannosidase
MNIIRIWGGGLYASEDLLDACDAYGILVWHDFQFACSGYPAMDPKFMRNVAAEADEQVRRLRHRASLALWCGNNEIEEGLTADLPGHMSLKDYNSLFDGLLPRTVRLLDGSTPYTRCSGHTPGSRRDRDHSFRLDSGDTHLWWNMRAQAAVAVDIDEKKLAGLDAEAKRRAKWDYIYRLHNGLDKYGRRTIIPRFASEYGRSCFPVMETLKGFASDKDMDPHSSVMECHQRGGNGWLVSEIVSRFKLPKDFPSFVLLSQLSQGESMRELVENWRASKPHNMGFLFWTYVDCWPAVEWSTVDYDLRRKASYYIFKRFYDPFLVCGLESKDLSACDIYGVNDLRTPVSGRMEWTLLRTDGTILLKGSKTAVIPALKSMKISALKFGGLVKDQGAGRCLLWIEFKTRGGAVHSNVVFFTNLNRMELGKPKIRMDRNSDGTIGLKTDIPALWAGIVKKDRLLDCDDNFFHMRPGRTYKVRPDKGESLDGIRIVSLCDTFLSK